MTFMTTQSSFKLPHATVDDFDLVCFSHLRWDFVFQRPQHLMTRFARNRRVFFIEEPVYGDDKPGFEISNREKGPFIVVPHLPNGADADAIMPRLIDEFRRKEEIIDCVAWFYTPMMLDWMDGLRPHVIVYDCMDELSLFKNAPKELIERENALLDLADLVFSGGQSLYEAKRERHPASYAFPSSIDKSHFEKALSVDEEPADQRSIPRPRIGFCGVIDERTDIELLSRIAEIRPDWQFIMLGPVVKIDEADLPRHENIHYLGRKQYGDLPSYIGGWDVAMMPFAMNDSTRFISPTKTPEYLAAGRPVVSTPIRDVVRPYGDKGLVDIAATPEEFVAAIEKAMAEDPAFRQQKAGEFLSTISWDKTQEEMQQLITNVLARKAAHPASVRISQAQGE
jgi:UDP-galactopyranose mutase